jgi:hypothetical protein
MKRFMLMIGALAMAGCAVAADLPKPEPTPGHVMLPQEHQYQRVLRKYMATLTEKDFDHGVTTPLTVQPSSQDADYQYRNSLRTNPYQVPLVGSKRGVPAVNNPPALFLLRSIEGTTAVMRPLVYPETLMALAQWDYPRNVYYNNRALKMRCFVTASINLLMLDDYLDKNPRACRADWRAYQLIIGGAPYPGFKDLLPTEVRRAYQDGVKKLARRIIAWGPRGEEPNLDMIIPIGLWYATKVCDDPAFTKEVEALARMMFTDPRYFHPAGYWVERGGLDVGFGGQANVFACAAALASDWPFAKEAVDRVYRLRAHLTLPEPDGTITGPAEFNTRLSSPAYADQWEFGWRDRAALMLTDEAACWVTPPAKEALAVAAASAAAEFSRQIAENPVKSGNGSPEKPYVYFANAEIPPQPWACTMWQNWQFPLTVDFGYEFYRKGAYDHLVQLEKENSPFLKFPFQRKGTFVRDFAGAFVVARMSDYGIILHTGPVGHQEPNNGLEQCTAPMGFGGGQLAAFWTPATGSVILGRRGGMIHEKAYDKIEEWRTWPIHAVSGVTAGGKVFTSARIFKPEAVVKAGNNSATAVAHGPLTAMRVAADPASTPEKPKQDMYDDTLDGRIDYARTFDVGDKGLRVETSLNGDGKDNIAELYETIPVYLRDTAKQPKAEPTAIEFEVGGKWVPATAEYQEKVTAVKLTRFDGAVQITFDHPRRIKLSPTEWKDTVAFAYGACRNVMVDLLEGAKAPVALNGETTISYEISPVAK